MKYSRNVKKVKGKEKVVKREVGSLSQMKLTNIFTKIL